MAILAAPHPSHVEFGLPEPFGSTLDVGFGRGDVGWRFWLPHIHQDREFGHPEPFGSTLDVAFGRGDVG